MASRLRPARRRTMTLDVEAPVALLALGALTVLAFALRVVGIDQSLFGDEYFTHAIVTENGLGGVWSTVYETSITPPLHYGLAWLAVQAGGDTIALVRLPSLVFGTATVPLIFFLGRRIGGDRVGLLAALLMTLSPFAIFYSTEARAYGTLMALVTLSALALIRAVEGEGRGWWIVYALSSCAALWTHYTAVFVLAAEAVWALWTHRELTRGLVLTQVAIAVGYLPWLPGFLEQSKNDEGIAVIGLFSPLSFERVFEFPLRTLIGHPFLGLGELPGQIGLLLVLSVLALAVAFAVRRPPGLRGLAALLRSERGLILMLALATPVGLLFYDVAGPTLYGTRNLSASLPALVVLGALVLGSLTTAAPRWLAAPAIASLVVVFTVAAIETVGDENRRPPYREVARYLDNVAGNDPIVEAPLDPSLDRRLGRSSLEVYFERDHRLYRWGQGDAAIWRRVRAGRSVYEILPLPGREALARSLVGLQDAPVGLAPRQRRLGGPDGRAVLRGSRTFGGLLPVTVRRYEGVVDGQLERRGEREVISWSFGKRVTVSPGVARGFLEGVTVSNKAFTLDGWALDSTHPTLPDWVLCFSQGRLLAVSAGGGVRRDIASAYGQSALLAGFSLRLPPAPTRRSAIRVFAVVGKRASELPLTEAAKRSL